MRAACATLVWGVTVRGCEQARPLLGGRNRGLHRPRWRGRCDTEARHRNQTTSERNGRGRCLEAGIVVCIGRAGAVDATPKPGIETKRRASVASEELVAMQGIEPRTLRL